MSITPILITTPKDLGGAEMFVAQTYERIFVTP